jgi:hypothetical protein
MVKIVLYNTSFVLIIALIMESVIDLQVCVHVILDILVLIVLNNILSAPTTVQIMESVIDSLEFVHVMTAISVTTVLYSIWCALIVALEMVFAIV